MFDQTWFYALVAGVIFYFVFFYKSRTNRLLAKFPTPAEGHVPLLGIMPFFLRTPRNGEQMKEICKYVVQKLFASKKFN